MTHTPTNYHFMVVIITHLPDPANIKRVLKLMPAWVTLSCIEYTHKTQQRYWVRVMVDSINTIVLTEKGRSYRDEYTALEPHFESKLMPFINYVRANPTDPVPQRPLLLTHKIRDPNL